jgi:hypothetical protein
LYILFSHPPFPSSTIHNMADLRSDSLEAEKTEYAHMENASGESTPHYDRECPSTAVDRLF